MGMLTASDAYQKQGGQILALARAPIYRRCGGYGCISALAVWAALGVAHSVAGAWVPVSVAHAATVVLVTAQCAFMSPGFGYIRCSPNTIQNEP